MNHETRRYGDGGDVNPDYTASTPWKDLNMADYIKGQRVDTQSRRPVPEQLYQTFYS
jgi:hypothetical protein